MVKLKRSVYYFKIYKYQQRRKEYKKKFTETGLEKYRIYFYNCSKKIAYWNQAIRRLDERKEKLNHLKKCVNEYFGVSIQNRVMDEDHKFARNVYYKIGMETRLRGRWLSAFIGRASRAAQIGRLRFTKQFKTDKSLKDRFHAFKEYYDKIFSP